MQYNIDFGAMSDVQLIRDRLRTVLGPQYDTRRFDPLSQLIFAMLSANTSDVVARAAFDRLRKRYKPWKQLSYARPEEILPLIRSVEHAERKADYIPNALRTIIQLRGTLDLTFLAQWSEEDATASLRKELRGVDAKIAATILNFSTLRKRVLPVDRHLLRVGKRLGLLDPKADYRKGYNGYMHIVPNSWEADELYEFHWLLKYHSQVVCTERPTCSLCPLRDICPSVAIAAA